MSRWTYQVIELKPTFFKGSYSTEELQSELTKQGSTDWELVQVIGVGTGGQPAKLVFKKEA